MNIPIKLLFCSFLFLSSCKKEKQCPAFNPDNEELIPYALEDTIKFTNEDSAVYSIIITDLSYSDLYTEEYKTLFNVKKVPCINYVSLTGFDSRSQKAFDFLRIEQSDVSSMQYYKYHIADFYFEFDFINELEHTNEMEQFSLIGNLEIGNKTYNNVIMVSDLNKDSFYISKIYFNQTDGILRIVERISNIVWSIS